MEELRRILAEGGSIYEELSFSLRHNVERTKASRASGMALVPAPMREGVNESAEPLDVAGTYRIATMKVPAPRLELGTGGSENIVRLQCITQVALEELERGTTRHAKAILATLKEVLSRC